LLEAVPVFVIEVKLPLFCPVNVFVCPVLLVKVNVALFRELFAELSAKVNVGFVTLLKSKVTFPKDSSVSKIPSLSKSTSKLSIIPSSSKSSGQILTGTSIDSNVVPVQEIVPINL